MTRLPSCDTRRRRSRRAAGAGSVFVLVAGCVACCAGPLLAVLGTVTASTALAAVWVPALAAVTVVAGIVMTVLLRRRRRVRAGAVESVPPYPVPRVGR